MRAQRVTLPGHLSEAASDRGDVRVRDLGTVAYAEAWEAMRRFTTARGPTTVDEVWLLDHPPVYTLGLNGSDPCARSRHYPVLRSDAEGSHLPWARAAVVVYMLVDLHAVAWVSDGWCMYWSKRSSTSVRLWVEAERGPARLGCMRERQAAALGLRGRRACSYHGWRSM